MLLFVHIYPPNFKVPYSNIFRETNFHELYKSMAIRDNFTIKIFTKNIYQNNIVDAL